MARILMKGNEAIAEAAIRAGCRGYFGYPITPQNEILTYMSWRMEEVGGISIQAESEIAAINMVFGASAGGIRAMTSSSSPGISLKQEGISYIAACELPAVIVNITRGGPGLGNIAPAQSDYFQSTKGGGHGDYHLLVLAPATVQEAADLTMEAFILADKYRNPVLILGDGILGQMVEPVEFKEPSQPLPEKPWALTGCWGRNPNVIKSLHYLPEVLQLHNLHLQKKYLRMKEEDLRYECFATDDAELVIVAFGITAKICKGVLKKARLMEKKIGILRPITLFPFPYDYINHLADSAKNFLVVEMNLGQMVEDVKLAVEGKSSVHFYGTTGGVVPREEDILSKIIKIVEEKKI